MVKKSRQRIEKFPITRQILSTYNEIIVQFPYMRGLVEVDVTDAKNKISSYADKTGKKISFTGWVIKAVSEAIKENKMIHAYRISKRKIVIPDEVRFGIMVERKSENGTKIPSMEVISTPESRTVIEISDEIRALQDLIIDEKEQLMGNQNIKRKLQNILFAILPDFISRRIIKGIATNKEFITKFSGTVGVTALGMFGKDASGYAIHFPTRTIDLALGTVSEKPRYIDGKLAKRDILNVTFNIDHNIVDGGPAARFVSRAIELMQSAFGLEDL